MPEEFGLTASGTVRVMRGEELRPLIQQDDRLLEETMYLRHSYLRNEPHMVAFDGDKIVGDCELQENPNNLDQFWLMHITTRVGYKGKGYASQLLKAAVEYVAKSGRHELKISSFSDEGEQRVKPALERLQAQHPEVKITFSNSKAGAMKAVAKLGPNKKANVQVVLPGPARNAVLAVAQQIPAEELGTDGIEDDPHVTIKFGVEEDLEKLSWAVAEQHTFPVVLGKMHVFTGHGSGGSPVVAEAHAADFHVLHELVDSAVGNRKDDFPYKPHVTIAFVKSEFAQKYEGLDWAEGISFSCSSLVLSRASGARNGIPFGGKIASSSKFAAFYHGTNDDFKMFKSRNGVYYFTDDQSYAEAIGNEKTIEQGGMLYVHEVELQINKPFDATGFGTGGMYPDEYVGAIGGTEEEFKNELPYHNSMPFWKFFRRNEAASRAALQRHGYDGVIWTESYSGYGSATAYVVFSPSQIKKTAAANNKYIENDECPNYPDNDFVYRGTSMSELVRVFRGEQLGDYWGCDFNYSSDFADGYAGGGPGAVLIANPAGRHPKAGEVVAIVEPHTGRILWERAGGWKDAEFEKKVEENWVLDKTAGPWQKAMLPAALMMGLTPGAGGVMDREQQRPVPAPIVQQAPKTDALDPLVRAISRAEGARPERHNPGNIADFNTGKIKTFKSDAEGMAALKEQLRKIESGNHPYIDPDMSLREAGLIYSNGDPNWAHNVASIMRVHQDIPIGRLIRGDYKKRGSVGARVLQKQAHKFVQAVLLKKAFTIEVPKASRDHFWDEPPEGNHEFWAFQHPVIVLPGEKIVFTFDEVPVAEAIVLRTEGPGTTECQQTGKYKDHHKVFWNPNQFRSL